MSTTTPAHAVDPFVRRHLDAWLDHAEDPQNVEALRPRMLALVADDPEHWLDVGWPRVRDAVAADLDVVCCRACNRPFYLADAPATEAPLCSCCRELADDPAFLAYLAHEAES